MLQAEFGFTATDGLAWLIAIKIIIKYSFYSQSRTIVFVCLLNLGESCLTKLGNKAW